MTKEIHCSPFKTIPVEFMEHESFKEIVTNDRLFLCLISHGTVNVRLNGCFTYFIAPCIVCLDNLCEVEYINSSNLQAQSISFNPAFININMTFDRIRSDAYADLANRHDFLLLSPFLMRTDNYLGYIPLEMDLLNMIDAQMNKIKISLNNYSDSRWSCRTRTGLMKIIYLLEDLYSEYTMNEKPIYDLKNPEVIVSIIVAYIRTHYQEKISSDELCQLVNFNRTSLLKIFKKITGKTISDFIIDYRLNASLHSLRFSHLTIDEIAKEFGFNYSSYYVKVFERKFNISPTDYRNLKISKRKAEFSNC